MKIYQTWRNYVAQVLLDTPAEPLVRRWLVSLHTDFFLDQAERDAEARKEHLDALFDASIDVYEQALDEGFPEAEAREITHIQGDHDFYNHGWAEYLEVPPEELDEHWERYADFYERHGCTPEDPLGEFAPPGGLPDAPETPERLEEDEFPVAESGMADDVYVPAPNLDART
ncbi:DUF6149 family protein [Halospeciosus flavus]|uniref:DUF6149 family protein n=1 Tax=Halospeciosus flavus TaxID=3032283 RepID=A0ABD5Z2C2_9EURY|nr:DUF6149 family protein [Halospeciosus flavus]